MHSEKPSSSTIIDSDRARSAMTSARCGASPTSEPRAITRGAYPRFSRDGNWISFVRIRNGNADVWLMRGDGSARRKITDSSFDESFPSPSPDGRYVVYASSRAAEEEEEENQLYLTRVVDGVEIQLTHGGQNGRPVW